MSSPPPLSSFLLLYLPFWLPSNQDVFVYPEKPESDSHGHKGFHVKVLLSVAPFYPTPLPSGIP